MNFYSDPKICEAIAAGYFPGQSVRQTQFQVGGKRWQIPAVDGIEPVTRSRLASTFIDFYDPLDFDDSSDMPQQPFPGERAAAAPEPADCAPTQPYLPKVSQGFVSTQQWEQEQLSEQYQPAPTLLWESVGSWEAFLKHHKRIFADHRRRQRKLERELGTVQFTFQDPDPALLQDCMALKSQQYRTTGEPDLFAIPEHVRFFAALAERGLLTVSSLRAGDRLMAAHIGVESEGRFYYWIPAYDSSQRQYAPGALLLGAILQESFERGHREFDFLIGNEPYKWFYATHARLIGEIGRPPMTQWMVRSLKQAAKPLLLNALNTNPGLKSRVKAVAMKLGA